MAFADALQRWLRANRNLTVMELVIWSLNGVFIVSAGWLAIWLWMRGSVTLGAIAVVTGMTLRLINISGWIFWVVAEIFENIGTAKEGMQTIAKANAIIDAPAAVPLVVPKGEIVYERVKFNYGRAKGLEGADPNRVIENLSFTIRPGEKVGLVGRSGAGKSTLVNLLLRFYDLEGGRILIDGQDIAKVTQDSLRANIGMVTQDTSLMHRAVRDNILYGRPTASEEDLLAASQRAQAHQFITGLEDGKGRKGYHAHVGERGVKLSGGQRQRIAIARVLLKNAPILILDEATSALDSEVEAAIQEQLYNLMEGKTVIAIAHRLSTIAAMDRLIIMDQGRIVEEGTPPVSARQGRHLRRPVEPPERRLPRRARGCAGRGGIGATSEPWPASLRSLAVGSHGAPEMKILTASILAIGLAATGAFAQTKGNDGPAAAPKSAAECEAAFKAADKNGDGRLDAPEAEAAKATLPASTAAPVSMEQFVATCSTRK